MGSYEALRGGCAAEAMEDFRFNLLLKLQCHPEKDKHEITNNMYP